MGVRCQKRRLQTSTSCLVPVLVSKTRGAVRHERRMGVGAGSAGEMQGVEVPGIGVGLVLQSALHLDVPRRAGAQGREAR